MFACLSRLFSDLGMGRLECSQQLILFGVKNTASVNIILGMQKKSTVNANCKTQNNVKGKNVFCVYSETEIESQHKPIQGMFQGLVCHPDSSVQQRTKDDVGLVF